MAKAVVFFAEGTEECEALLVVDLLRRAKVEVLVASASGIREILSSHKVHITADALAEEVDYSDVDLVVLPGGIPGTPNLAANKTVTDTCVAFAKAGKKVAAICAAPSVLAALGLLEGKNATAHAAFQDKLAGAHVLDTEVVVDGNITTSYGLGGAIKKKSRVPQLWATALLAVRGLWISQRPFFQLPAAHAVHCRLRSAPG